MIASSFRKSVSNWGSLSYKKRIAGAMMPSDAFGCKLFILVAFLLASITQSKMNQ